MHKLVRQLVTRWRAAAWPQNSSKIVVAVSGGADSTALLFALQELVTRKKIKIELVVAHFNHKLRGSESDADAEFVRSLAERLVLPVMTGESSGSLTDRRANLEQRAREERYAFFADVARKLSAAAVVTGHTLDDQAETLLLNLIRGGGLDGLAAMREYGAVPAHDDVILLRPWLGIATRDEIREFCTEREIEWRQDVMNDDLRFTRVRIRRELLPLLSTFNPKIVPTLARTAALLRPLAEADSATEVSVSAPLIRELRRLDNPALATQIRHWLRHHRGHLRGISQAHIDGIVRLILSSKSGRTAELPGGIVVKKGGKLSWHTTR